MRAHPDEGWLEFLYKPRGIGLAKLAARRPGEVLSVMAPIGHGFTPDSARPHWLALGGGVGIPPMIFLADQARKQPAVSPLVVMGSEVPFPFELVESQLDVPGVAAGASHSVALLERWGVPSRLASNANLAGALRGFVTDLARGWLAASSAQARAQMQVFACGPTPMLKAVAALAREFDLPCQLALEEFMACGIGGCAGCNVLLQTADGPAMKRVCVDGPVFDAREVFPA
jgi:dihydroorotate dehydrogenase electron transfer subunit